MSMIILNSGQEIQHSVKVTEEITQPIISEAKQWGQWKQWRVIDFPELVVDMVDHYNATARFSDNEIYVAIPCSSLYIRMTDRTLWELLCFLADRSDN